MRSLWNPNRFLRSVSQSYWGNPQPTKAFAKCIQRSVFNSTNKARCKIVKHRFTVLRSRPA